MATSPTVLASAVTSPPAASAPLPVAAKIPVFSLLIAVIAGVVVAVLGVGGVVYYLTRTGKLPMQGTTARKTEAAVPVVSRALVLEPLLVNLADAGGSSYLRVAITLRVAEATDKESAKKKPEAGKEDKGSDDGTAPVRDTVLSVLGRQTADGLLAPEGKEHLKAELKTALTKQNPDLKVIDVFFTDFLVQR